MLARVEKVSGEVRVKTDSPTMIMARQAGIHLGVSELSVHLEKARVAAPRTASG